jgi:hypothetical protein
MIAQRNDIYCTMCRRYVNHRTHGCDRDASANKRLCPHGYPVNASSHGAVTGWCPMCRNKPKGDT